MWALYTIFECYQKYCHVNNYRHIVNGKDLGALPQVLSDQDKKRLSFVHVMLVQGNVIEAVKHSEGGSAAFKKYFLDGMTEKENIEFVRNELITSIDNGGYGLTTEDANKMLFIVQWAKEVKLLTAVKNFITKYNKGTLPKDDAPLLAWEDFIQANSYFGNLIKPLFDIKVNIEVLEKQVKEVSKDVDFASEMASMDLGGLSFSTSSSSESKTPVDNMFANLRPI